MSHKNIFDVKICAKYIFVPYTLQKTKNFEAESHSIIHSIAFIALFIAVGRFRNFVIRSGRTKRKKVIIITIVTPYYSS